MVHSGNESWKEFWLASCTAYLEYKFGIIDGVSKYPQHALRKLLIDTFAYIISVLLLCQRNVYFVRCLYQFFVCNLGFGHISQHVTCMRYSSPLNAMLIFMLFWWAWPLKTEDLSSSQFCRQWWYQRLSLWQKWRHQWRQSWHNEALVGLCHNTSELFSCF